VIYIINPTCRVVLEDASSRLSRKVDKAGQNLMLCGRLKHLKLTKVFGNRMVQWMKPVSNFKLYPSLKGNSEFQCSVSTAFLKRYKSWGLFRPLVYTWAYLAGGKFWLHLCMH